MTEINTQAVPRVTKTPTPQHQTDRKPDPVEVALRNAAVEGVLRFIRDGLPLRDLRRIERASREAISHHVFTRHELDMMGAPIVHPGRLDEVV